MEDALDPNLDPRVHLAAEDLWLDRIDDGGARLMFWRCDRTVVIGKNQNPWRECGWPAMRIRGIRLARRVSGGGAVYHDAGNLNYAWFCDRAGYDRDRVFDRVLEALRRVGVDAARMGPTSIGVDGRKVSGTAFCFRRNAVLHHGTFLVQADLDALRASLAGAGAGIDTHAVASEPAPVANLADLAPGLSMDRLKASVQAVFEEDERQPVRPAAADGLPPPGLARRGREMDETAWLLGATPRFTWDLAAPLSVRLTVVDGKVAAAAPLEDGVQAAAARLQDSLAGRWLTADDVRPHLEDLPVPTDVQAAWMDWADTRLAPAEVLGTRPA